MEVKSSLLSVMSSSGLRSPEYSHLGSLCIRHDGTKRQEILSDDFTFFLIEVDRYFRKTNMPAGDPEAFNVFSISSSSILPSDGRAPAQATAFGTTRSH